MSEKPGLLAVVLAFWSAFLLVFSWLCLGVGVSRNRRRLWFERGGGVK